MEPNFGVDVMVAVSPRRSDVNRPVARILPAIVSNTVETKTQSAFNCDVANVRDDEEGVKDRQRPPLLTKPQLVRRQAFTKPQLALLAAVGNDAGVTRVKQSPLSSSSTSTKTPTGTDERRQTEVRTADIVATQQLKDIKILSVQNVRLCRQRSEPAGSGPDTGLIEYSRCAVRQRRQSTSHHQSRQEVNSNCVAPSEQSHSSSVGLPECEEWPKSKPNDEMFENWTLSLGEEQLHRVELFYSSHAAEVSVARCLASLHITSPSIQIARQSFSGDVGSASRPRTVWNQVGVGVPLLLVDTGEGRRRRRLHVILADPRTGFTLWRESIDHLTDYRSPVSGLHTLRQSTDHARLAAIRFYDHSEATRMLKVMEKLTSDPDDSLLNIAATATSSTKRRGAYNRKWKTTKASISSPCWFSHVTRLDRAEVDSVLCLNSSSTAIPQSDVT